MPDIYFFLFILLKIQIRDVLTFRGNTSHVLLSKYFFRNVATADCLNYKN